MLHESVQMICLAALPPLPQTLYLFQSKNEKSNKTRKVNENNIKQQCRSSVRRHFRRSTKSFTLANALTLTVYCMSLHRPIPIATGAVAFL